MESSLVKRSARQVRAEYARGKNVTIEQLLWQVSGIPDYLSPLEQLAAAHHFASLSSLTQGGPLSELAPINNLPLEFEPGTKWEYSNTNYLLLGYVIARVSRVPWDTYIRKHIFERAGMVHSSFIQNEASLPNMATGYGLSKSTKRQRVAPTIPSEWAGGAGAIVSTVGDLAKWDDAFFGGRIIANSDVQLETSAHVLPSGASAGYGFGWFIDTLEGQPHIWHGGGTWGFQSSNEYLPKQHEFIIVLINSGNALAPNVSAAALNTLHPEVAAGENKSVAGEDPKITALVLEWMKRIQSGDFDRSQLTKRASSEYPPTLVATFKSQFAGLGDSRAAFYRGKETHGDITAYIYRIEFKETALTFTLSLENSGKIADLDISR